jgi:hypothetical protein
MKHLQASFRKYQLDGVDEWTAGVESGQGESPRTGAEVTIHKKDGTLKQVTLVSKVGEQGIGEAGKHITFWTFFEGWTESGDTLDEATIAEENDDEPF